jgi:ATP-binding cassette subfamily F protein uup
MKLQHIVWGAGVSNLKAIRKANNDIKLIELLSVSEKEIVEKIAAPIKTEPTKKLSFKEKFELENLEKEMPELQLEKEKLEHLLSTNLPYEDIQKSADRIGQIVHLLDEKEMRWLELSERNN